MNEERLECGRAEFSCAHPLNRSERERERERERGREREGEIEIMGEREMGERER